MIYLLFLILLFYTINLGLRISRLEAGATQDKVPLKPLYDTPARHLDTPVQDTQTTVVDRVSETLPIQAPAIAYSQIPLVQKSTTDSQFVKFFQEDLLVKLGAFLLLCAFGWGVSYAFANNWIGPIGRIVLGVSAGVAIISFGTFWIRKNFNQAAIFLVLGLSVFNLTIFAARFIYDFLNPLTVIILLFTVVSYVTYLSVKHNSQNLALACLVFGGIAPMFTAGEPSALGLFSYLLLFVLGVMWVVYIRVWHSLTFAALGIVTVYSLPFILFSTFSESEMFIGVVFANIFGIVFLLFNGLNIVRGHKVAKEQIATGLGTGLFITAWILSATDGFYESLQLGQWAAVFLLAAFTFLVLRQQRDAFYLFGSIGLTLLAVTTATVFDGNALALAYTIEAGFAVILVQQILKQPQITVKMTLVFIGPLLLSLQSLYSSAWQGSILHQDFFVLLVFTITVLLVGLFLRRIQRDDFSSNLAQTGNALLSISALFGLTLLIRSSTVYFDSSFTTIVFIVAVAALVLLLHSIYNNQLLTARVSYVMGLPAFIALASLDSSLWNLGVLHKDFYIPLVFVFAAVIIGLFNKILNNINKTDESTTVTRVLFYTAAVFGLVLVWLISHAVIVSEDIAITVALIIYTITGLSLYVYGRALDIKHYQYAGGIILGFVLARLLLVDVWRMDLLLRIITFFMVGILLMSTAFYGRKKKVE